MAAEQIVDGVAVSTTAAGILGGWHWWQNHHRKKKQAESARWKAQEEFNAGVRLAMVSTQHHMIYELCMEHLNAGYITLAALDDLDHLMRGYEAMGGDGTAHTLQERVHHLPVRDSMEPSSLRGAYSKETRERLTKGMTVENGTD
jgi:hypothetical protein